jgi:hypothetical protein
VVVLACCIVADAERRQPVQGQLNTSYHGASGTNLAAGQDFCELVQSLLIWDKELQYHLEDVSQLFGQSAWAEIPLLSECTEALNIGIQQLPSAGAEMIS